MAITSTITVHSAATLEEVAVLENMQLSSVDGDVNEYLFATFGIAGATAYDLKFNCIRDNRTAAPYTWNAYLSDAELDKLIAFA